MSGEAPRTIPRDIGPCPACGEHDARLCDCEPEGRTRPVPSTRNRGGWEMELNT